MVPMTWSYASDAANDPKDAVRLLVGDIVSTKPLVQDEDIEYALVLFPPATGKPAWLAAAYICDAIAGVLARKIQQSVGSLAQAGEQQFEHYKELAANLRVAHQTNGLGLAGLSPTARVVAASPVLSGGGPTVLGG